MFEKALGNFAEGFSGCSLRDPKCFLSKIIDASSNVVRNDPKLMDFYNKVTHSDAGKYLINQIKGIQTGNGTGNGNFYYYDIKSPISPISEEVSMSIVRKRYT
jgi:hypothetical protein